MDTDTTPSAFITKIPRRILIVSYFFPPTNMVASIRIYSFAKYLARAGYEVTVLTTDCRSSGSDQSLHLDCSGFDVVRVKYGITCIKNIDVCGQNAMKTKGYSQLVWNTLNWFVRKASDVKNSIVGNSVMPEDLWFPYALFRGLELVRRKDFDVLLSSFGPITSHWVGLWLKMIRPDLLWIADYRDPWTGNPFMHIAKSPISYLQFRLERYINSCADVITTVSEPLVEDYFKDFSQKAYVVENGYLSDYSYDDNETKKYLNKFICTFTGTYYSNMYQFSALFAAIKLLIIAQSIANDALELRFYGNNSHQLRSLICQEHLEGTIVPYPAVTHRESQLLQRKSHALIFFSTNDRRCRGFYGAKIFEYLCSGTPIIVIGNSDDNCAAQLVSKAGAGFVCGDDVTKIVDAFKKIMIGDLPQRNEEVISSFRRDRLARKLIEIIEKNMVDKDRHNVC